MTAFKDIIITDAIISDPSVVEALALLKTRRLDVSHTKWAYQCAEQDLIRAEKALMVAIDGADIGIESRKADLQRMVQEWVGKNKESIPADYSIEPAAVSETTGQLAAQ